MTVTLLAAHHIACYFKVPDSLALPPPAPPDTADHLSEQTLEKALPPLDAIHGAFAEVQTAHIQIPSWWPCCSSTCKEPQLCLPAQGKPITCSFRQQE